MGFSKNFARFYEIKKYLEHQTLGRQFICPIDPATEREFILDWRISNQKDILKTWKARSKSQLRTQISLGTWFKIWKINSWLVWATRSEQFGADYEQRLRLVFLKFSFWKHCSICIIEVKKVKKKLGSLF